MPFPALKPSARGFDPGNWPVKEFSAQSGAEVRILYGDTRVDASLTLTYENITSTQAATFMAHYEEVRGTFKAFALSTQALAGTSGSVIKKDSGTSWRYAEPPTITSVKNGRETVTVKLKAIA